MSRDRRWCWPRSWAWQTVRRFRNLPYFGVRDLRGDDLDPAGLEHVLSEVTVLDLSSCDGFWTRAKASWAAVGWLIGVAPGRPIEVLRAGAATWPPVPDRSRGVGGSILIRAISRLALMISLGASRRSVLALEAEAEQVGLGLAEQVLELFGALLSEFGGLAHGVFLRGDHRGRVRRSAGGSRIGSGRGACRRPGRRWPGRPPR